MGSPFARSLLRRMLRALHDHGDPSAPTSPMRDDWLHNLHPALRSHAEALVAAGLPLHSHVAALHSSQAFALNLALPFAIGRTEGLAAFLSRALAREVEVVGLDVEYVGSGDLLAEVAGSTPTAREHATAADIAVHLRDANGARGILLIEVKLAEGGFTPCGGRHSRGNRDHATCRSRALFFAEPHRCYLQRPYHATRDRNYWALFAAAHGDLARAFPGASSPSCPFEGDFQQPMRNHALAVAHVQTGRADFWGLALVHHDANPDVPGPWDAYRAATADADHLHRWPASTLLDALTTALPNATLPLGPWLRNRYHLGAPA